MPISAPPPRRIPARKYTPSPDAAGMLSFLFPGLGQMWSGEKRKGTLFMLAHLINLSALFNIICAPFVLKILAEFGQRYHMKLNVELSDSFQHLGPGSPSSIIVMLLLLSFSLFAARDAFDQSKRQKRQAIYHDYVVAMPEATSGSYIFHVSLLLVCLVLAFFFLIPPLPRPQVTVIEFGQTEQNTKEKVVTNRHALNNARAAGHNDPRKLTELSSAGGASQPKSAPREVKPAPSKSLATKSPSSKSAAAAPPEHTPVKTTALARDSRPPLPNFAPRPLPPTQSPAAPTAPTPLPVTARSLPPVPATPRAVAAPVPVPASNLPLPAPAPTSITGLHVAPASVATNSVGAPKLPTGVSRIASLPPGGAPGPMPVNAGSGTAGGVTNNVTPVPVTGHGSHGGTQTGSAPSPTKASGNPGTMPGGVPGSTLTPVVLGAGPSTGHGHTGQGTNNNPGEGARPGENLDSTPDVNWMPYMADLQRRIKRNWYPPKAPETKRVKVIFTLSTDGTLSNLRIVRSSGLQLADVAALKAVENAAPFRPLPPHAPASVDIEFTFDYNIFSGGGLR